MSKTLFYRLFGIGKIPAATMSQLQGEEILFLEEGIRGTVTYTNFHRPGMYAGWRRVWSTASIALTKMRLFALNNNHQVIDVPITDPRIQSMNYSVEDNGSVFCVKLDASLFRNDWSGNIEYRFHTDQAQQLLDLLQQQFMY
jgi:hypothetical protein